MRLYSRQAAGFTLIELVVAVGLMMLLMSVVTTVFSGSQKSVTNAEESIDIIQRARTLHARLSKDLSGAVLHMTQSSTGDLQRAFSFENPATTPSSLLKSSDSLYFVSQTTQNGQLGTWDVAYIVVPTDGTSYSRIHRLQDYPDANGNYTLWDWATNDIQNTQLTNLASSPLIDFIETPEPGKPVFSAHELWEPVEGGLDTNFLPQYVKIDITFLGKYNGAKRKKNMQFLIPIYQGK